MDDFDVFGDFAPDLNNLLDSVDLWDADLNLAEFSPMGDIAPAAVWHMALTNLNHAGMAVHSLLEFSQDLVPDGGVGDGLRTALDEVAALHSPFTPVGT